MSEYISLALTKEEMAEKQEAMTTPLAAELPKYPHGLSVTLDEKILEKLNVDSSEWQVGHKFPVDVIWEITGINKHESQENSSVRVDMQIIAIKPEEYEEEQEEAEEYDEEPSLERHGYLRYK